MRFILILAVALSATSGLAAEGALGCKFGALEIQGELRGASLQIARADGLSVADLNQNPIPGSTVKGQMKFTIIDSTDTSAGTSYELSLSAEPSEGENPATLSTEQYSIGTTDGQQLDGSCTLTGAAQ